MGRRWSSTAFIQVTKSIVSIRVLLGILFVSMIVGSSIFYTSHMLKQSSTFATSLVFGETYPHLSLRIGSIESDDFESIDSLLGNISQIPQISEVEFVVNLQASVPMGDAIPTRIVGLTPGSKIAYWLGIDNIQELESNEVYLDKGCSTNFSIGEEIDVSYLMMNGSYFNPLLTNLTIKGFKPILDTISEKAYPENDRLNSIIGNNEIPLIMNLFSSQDILLNQTSVASEKMLLISIGEYSISMANKDELLHEIEILKHNIGLVFVNRYQLHYTLDWISNDIDSLYDIVDALSFDQYIIWMMLLLSDWFILAIIVRFLIRDSSIQINRLRERGIPSRTIWHCLMFSGISMVGIGSILGTISGSIIASFTQNDFMSMQILYTDFLFLLVAIPLLLVVIAISVLWKPSKSISYENYPLFEIPNEIDDTSSRTILLLTRVGIIIGIYYIFTAVTGISSKFLIDTFGINDLTTFVFRAIFVNLEIILTIGGPIVLPVAIALLFSFETDRITKFVNNLLIKINGKFGEISAKSSLSLIRGSQLTVILLVVLASFTQISLMQISTTNDQYQRMTSSYVGSDATIILSSNANSSNIIDALSIIPEIMVYSIVEFQSLVIDDQITMVRSIDPLSWLQTAYYEDSWLEVGSFSQTINGLQDNDIVLSEEESVRLEKGIGDWINISSPSHVSSAESYRIVNIIGSDLDFDGFPSFTSFILRDGTKEPSVGGVSETRILVKLQEPQIHDDHLQIVLNHPDVIRVIQSSSVDLPLNARYWIQSRLFLSQIVVDCFIVLDIGTIFIIAFFQSKKQKYEIDLLKLKGIRNSYIFRIFSLGMIVWNLIIISAGFIVGTIAQLGVTALRNAHLIGSIKERCLLTPDILSVFSICYVVSIGSIILFHQLNIRKQKQGEKRFD